MYSLDYSLFYDNVYLVFVMFFLYIIVQKNIISIFVLSFKWKQLVTIVLYKELFLYNYNFRSIIYFNYFDSYNHLNEFFFLTDCKPILLNYSYIRNNLSFL